MWFDLDIWDSLLLHLRLFDGARVALTCDALNKLFDDKMKAKLMLQTYNLAEDLYRNAIASPILHTEVCCSYPYWDTAAKLLEYCACKVKILEHLMPFRHIA